MGQESCRNDIYANGLVQMQSTGPFEEILLSGRAINRPKGGIGMISNAFVRLLGSIGSVLAADIVTGVVQGRHPGISGNATQLLAFHPPGLARRCNVDASDFSFFSKRFAGA
jgi:hypothetical protein